MTDKHDGAQVSTPAEFGDAAVSEVAPKLASNRAPQGAEAELPPLPILPKPDVYDPCRFGTAWGDVKVVAYAEQYAREAVRFAATREPSVPRGWLLRWPKVGGGHAWHYHDGPAEPTHMPTFPREAVYSKPAQAPSSDSRDALDELRATICGVGIFGNIDGHDLIRRDSVIDLIDRRRAALREGR